jgi:hypothetical protein
VVERGVRTLHEEFETAIGVGDDIHDRRSKRPVSTLPPSETHAFPQSIAPIWRM